MPTANITDPFKILLEIEYRSKQYAAGLPQQVEIKKQWSGIGFKIGDVKFVSTVGDVNEILYYPKLTKIPGTKNWVKGLANIRGILMPIIDLRGYLGKSFVNIKPRSRILIIHHKDLWAGLLVDEVMGLKHFYDDEKIQQIPHLDDTVNQYIIGGYQQNDASWFIFNMRALAANPEFLLVSA
jgi:twitching motility protein PilI